MDSREWHGPAKVLGQDGQQVLIKNESTYIRVQSCRPQLINQNSKNNQDTSTSRCIPNKNDKHDPQPHNKISKNQHHLNIENLESEDEDPNTRKSTNHHSLNQTNNHEIQGQPYHIVHRGYLLPPPPNNPPFFDPPPLKKIFNPPPSQLPNIIFS